VNDTIYDFYNNGWNRDHACSYDFGIKNVFFSLKGKNSMKNRKDKSGKNNNKYENICYNDKVYYWSYIWNISKYLVKLYRW